VADGGALLIGHPQGDEALDARGVFTQHAERPVASAGDRHRHLDDAAQHGLEVQLGGEGEARLDEHVESIVVAARLLHVLGHSAEPSKARLDPLLGGRRARATRAASPYGGATGGPGEPRFRGGVDDDAHRGRRDDPHIHLEGRVPMRSQIPMIWCAVRAIPGVVGLDARLTWELDDTVTPISPVPWVGF
jgi:hypothetical protein